jgi:hypothetical protein
MFRSIGAGSGRRKPADLDLVAQRRLLVRPARAVRIDSIAFADLLRLGDPDGAVVRSARAAAERTMARKTGLGFRDGVSPDLLISRGTVWCGTRRRLRD